jgi:hypothetical protein
MNNTAASPCRECGKPRTHMVVTLRTGAVQEIIFCADCTPYVIDTKTVAVAVITAKEK